MTSSRKAADTHEAGNAEPRRTPAPESTQALVDVDAHPRSSDHLPGTIMAKMSAAFGVDFSAVRVHQQHRTPRAVAYTRGVDVYFRPGAYDPHSTAGLELIGHELAHVVQQFEGRVASRRLDANPTLEREADAMGARAARGLPVRSSAVRLLDQLPRVSARGSTIQRRQLPDTATGVGFQLVDTLPVAPRLAEYKNTIKLPSELSEALDEESESDSLHELTIGLYKVTGDDAKTRFELALSWQAPDGQAHATLAVDLDALGRSFMQRFEQPLQQLGGIAPQLRIDEADSAKRNALVIKAGPGSPAWGEAEWKLENLVKAATGRRFQLAPDRFRLEHKNFGLLAKGDYQRPIGTQVGEAFEIPEAEDLSALRSLAGVGEDTKLCCAVYWDASSRMAGLALDPDKATLDSNERLPVAFGVAVNVQTLLDGVARVANAVARLLPREGGEGESNDLLARLANAAREFADGLLSISIDNFGSFEFDLGRLLPRISTGGGFDWSRFVPGRFEFGVPSLSLFRASMPDLPDFGSISTLKLPKRMVPRVEGWLVKLVPELSGDKGLRRALQGLPLDLMQFGDLDLGLRFGLDSVFEKLGLGGMGADQVGLHINIGELLDHAGAIGKRLRAWFEREAKPKDRSTPLGQNLARLFHLGNDLVLRIYDDPQGNRIGFDLAPLLDGDFDAVAHPVELHLEAAGLASLSFGRHSDGVVVLGEYGEQTELRVRSPRKWLLEGIPVDGEAKQPLDDLLGLSKQAVVQMSLGSDRHSLHVLVSVEQPAVAMMMTIEFAALIEQFSGLLPSVQLGKGGSTLDMVRDMVRVDTTSTTDKHMLVVEFGPPERAYGSAEWSLERLMRLGLDRSALMPDSFKLGNDSFGTISRGPFVKPEMDIVGQVFPLGLGGKLKGARALAGAPAKAPLHCAIYKKSARVAVGLSANESVLSGETSAQSGTQDEGELPATGFLAEIDLEALLALVKKVYANLEPLLERDQPGKDESEGWLKGLNIPPKPHLGMLNIELPAIGTFEFNLPRLIPQLSSGGGFDWSKFLPDSFSLNIGPVAAFNLPQAKLPSFHKLRRVKPSTDAAGRVHSYLSRLIPSLPELPAIGDWHLDLVRFLGGSGEGATDAQKEFNDFQIGLTIDLGALLGKAGLKGIEAPTFALQLDLGSVTNRLGGIGQRVSQWLSPLAGRGGDLANCFDIGEDLILRLYEPRKPTGNRIGFDLKRLLSDEPASALRPVELHLVDDLGELSYGAREGGAIIQPVPRHGTEHYAAKGERVIANMPVSDAARTTLVDLLDGEPKSAVRLSLYAEGLERAHLLVDIDQPPLGLLISLELERLAQRLAKLIPPAKALPGSGKGGVGLDMVRVDVAKSRQTQALVLEFGPKNKRYGSATWQLERLVQLDGFEPSALVPDVFEFAHGDFGSISKGPFAGQPGWTLVGEAFEIKSNDMLRRLVGGAKGAKLYVAVYDARPTLGVVLGPSAASVEGRDTDTVAFAASVNLETLFEAVKKLGTAAAGLLEGRSASQRGDLSARMKAAIFGVADGFLDLRVPGFGSIGFDLRAALPRLSTGEGIDWSQLLPSKFDLEFRGLRLFRQAGLEKLTNPSSDEPIELPKHQLESVMQLLAALAPELSAVWASDQFAVKIQLYTPGGLQVGLGLSLILGPEIQGMLDQQGIGSLPSSFGLVVDFEPLLAKAGKAWHYLRNKLGNPQDGSQIFHLGSGPTLRIYRDPNKERIGFDLNPILRGEFAAALIPTELHIERDFGSISYGALGADSWLNPQDGNVLRPSGTPIVTEYELTGAYEWVAERFGLVGRPKLFISLYGTEPDKGKAEELQVFGRIEQPSRGLLITIKTEELVRKIEALLPARLKQKISSDSKLSIDVSKSMSEQALAVSYGQATASWKLDRFLAPELDLSTLMPDSFSLAGKYGNVGRKPFVRGSRELVGLVNLGDVSQLRALYGASEEQSEVFCAAYHEKFEKVALVLGPSAAVVEGQDTTVFAFVVEADVAEILEGLGRLAGVAKKLLPMRENADNARGGGLFGNLSRLQLFDGGRLQLMFGPKSGESEVQGPERGEPFIDFDLVQLLPQLVSGGQIELSKLVPSSFRLDFGPLTLFRLPSAELVEKGAIVDITVQNGPVDKIKTYLSDMLPGIDGLANELSQINIGIRLLADEHLKFSLLFDIGGLTEQLGELGAGVSSQFGFTIDLRPWFGKLADAGTKLLGKAGKGGKGLARYVHFGDDLILRIYANPNGNRIGFDLSRLLGDAPAEALIPAELHLEAKNFGALSLGAGVGDGVKIGERELVPSGKPEPVFEPGAKLAALARMLLGAKPESGIKLSFYEDSKRAHLFVRSDDPARALAITLEHEAIKSYLSKKLPKLSGGGRKPRLPPPKIAVVPAKDESELKVTIGSGETTQLSAAWKIHRLLRTDVDWSDLVPDSFSFGHAGAGRIQKGPISLKSGMALRGSIELDDNHSLRALVGVEEKEHVYCGVHTDGTLVTVVLGPTKGAAEGKEPRDGFLAEVETKTLVDMARKVGDKLGKLLAKAGAGSTELKSEVSVEEGMLVLKLKYGETDFDLGFSLRKISKAISGDTIDWSLLVPERIHVGMLELRRSWPQSEEPRGNEIENADLTAVATQLYQLASQVISALPELRKSLPTTVGRVQASGKKIEVSLDINLDSIAELKQLTQGEKLGWFGVTVDVAQLLDSLEQAGKSLLKTFGRTDTSEALKFSQYVHIGNDLVLRVIYPSAENPEFHVGFDLTRILAGGDIAAMATPVEFHASIGKSDEQPPLQISMGRLDPEGNLLLGDERGESAPFGPQFGTAEPDFVFRAPEYVRDLFGLPSDTDIGVRVHSEPPTIHLLGNIVGSDRALMLSLNYRQIADALGKLSGQTGEWDTDLSVSVERGYLEVTLTRPSGLVGAARWRMSRFFATSENGLVLAIPDAVSVQRRLPGGGDKQLGLEVGSDIDISAAGRPVVRNLKVPELLRDKLNLGSETAAYADIYTTLSVKPMANMGVVMAVAIKPSKGASVDTAHAMGLQLTLSSRLLKSLKEQTVKRLSKAGNTVFKQAGTESARGLGYWLDPELGGIAFGRLESRNYVVFSVAGIADALMAKDGKVDLSGLVPIGVEVSTDVISLSMGKVADGSLDQERIKGYTVSVDMLPDFIKDPLDHVGLGGLQISLDPDQSNLMGDGETLHLTGYVYRKPNDAQKNASGPSATDGGEHTSIPEYMAIGVDVSVWEVLELVMPGISSAKEEEEGENEGKNKGKGRGGKGKGKSKLSKSKRRNLTFDARLEDGMLQLSGKYKKDKNKKNRNVTLEASWSIGQLVRFLLNLATDPGNLDIAQLVPENIQGIFEADKFAVRIEVKDKPAGKKVEPPEHYAEVAVADVVGLDLVFKEFMSDEGMRQCKIGLNYPSPEDFLSFAQGLGNGDNFVYFIGAKLLIGDRREVGLDLGLTPRTLMSLASMIPGLQGLKFVGAMVDAVTNPEAAIDAAIYGPQAIYYAVTGAGREVDWDDISAKNAVMAIVMNDKSFEQLSKMAYISKRMADAGWKGGAVNDDTLKEVMGTSGEKYEAVAGLLEGLTDSELQTMMEIGERLPESAGEEEEDYNVADVKAAIAKADKLTTVLEAGYVTGKEIVETEDPEERAEVEERAEADMAKYVESGARPLTERIGAAEAQDGEQAAPAVEAEVTSIADLPTPDETTLAAVQEVLDNEGLDYSYLVYKFAWMSLDQLIELYVRGRLVFQDQSKQVRSMTVTSPIERGFIKLLIRTKQPEFFDEVVEKGGEPAEVIQAWEEHKEKKGLESVAAEQHIEEEGTGTGEEMSGGDSEGDEGEDLWEGEEEEEEFDPDAQADAEAVWEEIEQGSEWGETDGQEASEPEGEAAYFAPDGADIMHYKMIEWVAAGDGESWVLAENHAGIEKFKSAWNDAGKVNPYSANNRTKIAEVSVVIRQKSRLVSFAYAISEVDDNDQVVRKFTTDQVVAAVRPRGEGGDVVYKMAQGLDFVSEFGLMLVYDGGVQKVEANIVEFTIDDVSGKLVSCEYVKKNTREGELDEHVIRVSVTISNPGERTWFLSLGEGKEEEPVVLKDRGSEPLVFYVYMYG